MYVIALACAEDVDGIVELLQANTASRGGSLTGEFPHDKVVKMALNGAPVVVAHRDGVVVGVLFSAPKDAPAPPSVESMLAAWPGGPDAYVYGPACVADTERGRGLLGQLYAALRGYRPHQEAVLFIRRDNTASLRAHERLGMREVAGFAFDDSDYVVMSNRQGGTANQQGAQ
jgi:hypothetical protein